MGKAKNALQRKKVLLIAYAFPPVPYSGSYRVLRLCKGLVKLGVEVHALSIEMDHDIPNDYELLSRVPREVDVHRTRIFDPWLRYQAWKRRRKEMRGFAFLNKLASFFLRFVTLPDHQIFWIPFAVLKGRQTVRKHDIKTVLVSSPPVSSLLIGYFLKVNTKIRFIADLRDPIVGNIAQVNLIRPRDLMSKLERRILMGLERFVVKHADVVVTNTNTHGNEMRGKFTTDKFPTIRNAYDEEDYEGIEDVKYNKFSISHLGSMYGLRRADALFLAIRKLEERKAPEPLDLQVLFVGLNDCALTEAVAHFGVERYVKVLAQVPHREAIEIMVKSHLLLLIKATGEGSHGQIPAKFFEYLGTKNKIICLGPEKSEVAQIMRDLDAGVTIDHEEKRVFEVLEAHYDAFREGEGISKISHAELHRYNSDFMALNLIEHIS